MKSYKTQGYITEKTLKRLQKEAEGCNLINKYGLQINR